MEYSAFVKGGKKVSRFIVGTMNIVNKDDLSEDFKRLDDALDLGINVIDTAMGYGMGTTELALGKYFESRKNRDQIYLISKCCHPSPWRTRVTTYDMEADLNDALVKMHTDHIDLYMLHRDDPTKPVGPLVETLDKYYRAGKILAYGASNWTIDRIAEANDYCKAHGLMGFSVSSPNYSLAQQYRDPWAPGCISISGPENAVSQDWYSKTQMPVLAYSSMARGLFSGRWNRRTWKDNPEAIDATCLKAYCGDENFTRLERCAEIAGQRGCEIPQVAIAFILDGSMNVFPIIGAANRSEIESSIGALNVKLTPAEVAYLDLKSDTI